MKAEEDIMNRISFALKDPVLQMGFEVICSKLARLEKEKCELLGIIQGKDKVIQELKEENTKLKERNAEYADPKSQWISQHIQDVVQLTKAKEIIKEMLSILPKYDSQGLWLYRRSRALLKEDE